MTEKDYLRCASCGRAFSPVDADDHVCAPCVERGHEPIQLPLAS